MITERQKERRQNTIKKLKELDISYNENLSYIESSEEIKLKSIDEICKRIIASFCAIQVACDINQGNDYKESVEFFKGILEKYDIKNCFNEKEKRIFEGNYTSQDAIDLDWEYETMWALMWAVNLVDDISDGSLLCDCEAAITLIVTSNGFEDFKSKCHLRDIEEILDMLDLYYMYHWAIVEYRCFNNYAYITKENVEFVKTDIVNKKVKIGNLNSSNVVERRRGLEWLISNENDWYDIELNT
ncbi:MAG: DUF4272 domain-containing protein [Clostridia bacterium]|nr:DUF4272 domain-containing protein [Clostridia bacterium]